MATLGIFFSSFFVLFKCNFIIQLFFLIINATKQNLIETKLQDCMNSKYYVPSSVFLGKNTFDVLIRKYVVGMLSDFRNVLIDTAYNTYAINMPLTTTSLTIHSC